MASLMFPLLLLYVVGTFVSASGIPALLWSPERSMANLQDSSTATLVSSKSFLDNYLRPLLEKSEESGVVFLQDKLHVDDFTKFADVYSLDSDGGAFKNIKGMIEEMFSLELPEVEKPHQAVNKLKEDFFKDGKVHEVHSLEEMEKLNLNAGEKFLLVVHLKPVSTDVDMERAIKRNDEMVGEVCKHLQKRSIKYTAIFTGKSASEPLEEDVEPFQGRHLLQALTADANNGTFMNESGIFIFLRDAYVCIKTMDNVVTYCPLNFTLVPDDSTASSSSKTNTSATISLKWTGQTPTNSTGSYDLEIEILTRNDGDRWVITNMSLTTSGGTNGTMTDAPMRSVDLDPVIPILYSFHCSEFIMAVDSVHNKNFSNYQGTHVRLNGFQMQPFNIQQDRFFNPQDCVGFFTRGTWMGLFPTFILVIILIFGTMMVLNLSTMDKYDDPKGKTIYVPQSND